MFEYFITSLYGETVYRVLTFIFFLYPLWLPPILGLVFWKVWVRYIRYLNFSTTNNVLLEIKIPREITKSPLAMEVALTAIAQFSGEATIIKKYWEGSVRPWFSLEICSFGGEIRFFIWTKAGLRNQVEAQIYSQYPTVEIREVEDYTKNVRLDLSTMDLYASHFKFFGPNALPIRTYVDYGMDKDPKEEFKVDPLTSLLEAIASIKKTEQIWIQIIARVHKKEKREGLFSKATDWKDEAKKLVKEIQDSAVADPLTPGGFPRYRYLTQAEQDKVTSIERNISKYAFDCGIRCIYFAPKTDYSGGVGGMLKGVFKPFSSQTMNGITFDYATDFPDYPWQDFLGIRVNRRKFKLLDAYKRRMYFYDPYPFKPLIFSSEELATLFHIPSETAATPGLARIPSKKAQAPSNLPT